MAPSADTTTVDPLATVQQLAGFVLEGGGHFESPETLLAIECAVLDHLASAIHGSRLPWARIVREQAVDEARPGPAPVIGSGARTDALRAARANGTSSHAFELDDTHVAGLIHPGAVTIAAGLALGCERSSTGQDLARAVAAGYEVMARISLATGVPHSSRFHGTGTQGPFASATVAAVLMGFSTDELVNAWGVAASLAGGIKAFQTGGGMVKRLHPGRAAENGLYAAELVSRGFTGPTTGLAGERSFIDAYTGGQGDAGRLVEDLGQGLEIVRGCYVKPYASCGITHAAIDAVLELDDQHGIDPADVLAVSIGTSERGKTQNSNRHPEDTMDAQYSLECAVALAITGRAGDARSFEGEFWADPEIRRLLDLTDVHVEADVEGTYPEKLGASVTIESKSRGVVRAARAEPAMPPTIEARWDLVTRKFFGMTQGLLRTADQERLVESVQQLKEGLTVPELCRGLEFTPVSSP